MSELEKAKALVQDIAKTTYEDLRKADEARLEGTIKGVVDPLMEEKVAKINEFLNAQEAKLESLNARLKARDIASGSEVDAEKVKLEGDYKEVFNKLVRHGKDKLTQADADVMEAYRKTFAWAAGNGANNTGGYLVPTANPTEIIEKMWDYFPVLSIVDYAETTFDTVPFLLETSAATVVAGNNETTVASDTGIGTVDEVTATMVKYEAEPHVTRKLLQDAAFDVAGFINRRVARAYATKLSQDFITGNGTTGIAGVLNAVNATSSYLNVGKRTALNGDAFKIGFDLDDIFTAIASIDPDYRLSESELSILVSAKVKGAMRTMRTSDGHYLWQPSVQVGDPSVFAGIRVLEANHMPALTETTPGTVDADQPVMLLGNFKMGYGVRRHSRAGVEIEDIYTNKAYIKYYTSERMAGRTIDARALRALYSA